MSPPGPVLQPGCRLGRFFRSGKSPPGRHAWETQQLGTHGGDARVSQLVCSWCAGASGMLRLLQQGRDRPLLLVEAVADPPRPHGAPSERFPTLISTLLPVALSPSTPASARPKRLAQWANQPSSKRSGITRAPSCSCVSRAGTSSPLRCSTCRKRLDFSKRAFPGCSLQVNPLHPPLHHPPSSRTASSAISGDCPPVATCG